MEINFSRDYSLHNKGLRKESQLFWKFCSTLYDRKTQTIIGRLLSWIHAAKWLVARHTLQAIALAGAASDIMIRASLFWSESWCNVATVLTEMFEKVCSRNHFVVLFTMCVCRIVCWHLIRDSDFMKCSQATRTKNQSILSEVSPACCVFLVVASLAQAKSIANPHHSDPIVLSALGIGKPSASSDQISLMMRPPDWRSMLVFRWGFTNVSQSPPNKWNKRALWTTKGHKTIDFCSSKMSSVTGHLEHPSIAKPQLLCMASSRDVSTVVPCGPAGTNLQFCKIARWATNLYRGSFVALISYSNNMLAFDEAFQRWPYSLGTISASQIGQEHER